MISPAASRSGAREYRQRWFLAAVAAAVGMPATLPCLYLMAVASSALILSAPAGPLPANADTIVVLGGDGPARAAKAVQLWRAGLAHQAIVAGDGDCTHIRDAMVAGGVPREAIVIECLSGNTWMNAANSLVLLEALQARSAILVTSWFHTRRAIRVFELMCPGIRWFPAVTEEPPTLLKTALGPYGPAIAKEYFKVAFYRVRELLLPPGDPMPGDLCVQKGSST